VNRFSAPKNKLRRVFLVLLALGIAGFFQFSGTASALREFSFSLANLFPLGQARATIAQWTQAFLEFPELAKIRTDHAVLRAENEELRAKASELIEENRTLRSAFGIPEARVDGRLFARILWYDLSSSGRALFLDQGIDDGVVVGMPAVSHEGDMAIGSIVEVYGHSSLVRLLGDPATQLSVQFGEEATRGLARGKGEMLTFRLVPVDTPLTPGMPVFTAGHDPVFPRGLFVGWVQDIEQGSGGFQEGTIILAVRPEEFTTLFLLSVVHP